MTVRKLLKFVIALLIVFAIAVGLISINHPIILKWVTGSAKHHGKPIPAMIYTNGQLNNHFKVFYTDQANSYLLSLGEYDSVGVLKFINIDLNAKQVSRLVATSKNDLDLISGHLFQSKSDLKLSPFQADKKGTNFNPNLTFTSGEIRFSMPTNGFNIDSVRMILP